MFARLLPHKPPKIKPKDVPGAVIERGIQTPLTEGAFGLPHRDLLVWNPLARLGCSPGCGCQRRWVLPYVALAGEIRLSLGTEHHLMHPSKKLNNSSHVTHLFVHNMRAVVQFG